MQDRPKVFLRFISKSLLIFETSWPLFSRGLLGFRHRSKAWKPLYKVVLVLHFTQHVGPKENVPNKFWGSSFTALQCAKGSHPQPLRLNSLLALRLQPYLAVPACWVAAGQRCASFWLCKCSFLHTSPNIVDLLETYVPAVPKEEHGFKKQPSKGWCCVSPTSLTQ